MLGDKLLSELIDGRDSLQRAVYQAKENLEECDSQIKSELIDLKAYTLLSVNWPRLRKEVDKHHNKRHQ